MHWVIATCREPPRCPPAGRQRRPQRIRLLCQPEFWGNGMATVNPRRGARECGRATRRSCDLWFPRMNGEPGDTGANRSIGRLCRELRRARQKVPVQPVVAHSRSSASEMRIDTNCAGESLLLEKRCRDADSITRFQKSFSVISQPLFLPVLLGYQVVL